VERSISEPGTTGGGTGQGQRQIISSDHEMHGGTPSF
jgi:hypothetical protein